MQKFSGKCILVVIGLIAMFSSRTSSQPCSEVIILNVHNGTVFNITTPGYPRLYPENKNCEWRIQAEEGSILQLEFLQFHLEDNFDFLYLIKDGKVREDGVDFTGVVAPRIVLSHDHDIWLWFISDYAVAKSGFLIQVSLYNAESNASLKCLEDEVECGNILLSCFSQNYSCDAISSYRPSTEGEIELHHNGPDHKDLYRNMFGRSTVDVILGAENRFTCLVTNSELAAEITWSIGGKTFERLATGLMINSEVLLAQSSTISEHGFFDTTGTIRFTPTREHQRTNLTCTVRSSVSAKMGIKSPSLSIVLNVLAAPRTVTISAFDPVIGDMVSFHTGDAPSTLNVIQDEPISVSCMADDADPNAFLSVTINEVQIDVKYIVFADGHWFDTRGNWTLSSPKYAEFHNAVVQCTARNAINPTGIAARVKLNVVVPPEVTLIYDMSNMLAEPAYSIALGDAMRFKCIARNANPFATIVWTINDLVLNDTETTKIKSDGLIDTISVLESTLVKREYCNRMLTCLAAHVANDGSSGRNNQTVKLKVRAAPRTVTISAFDPVIGDMVFFHAGDAHSTLNIIQDMSISVFCMADDADPSAYLSVTVNEVQIDVEDIVLADGHWFDTRGDWTLPIPKYAKLHNAVVQCTARNAINPTGVVARVKLNVVVPPEDTLIYDMSNILAEPAYAIALGDAMRFKCIARNANPPATIVWTLNDLVLNDTETTIIKNDGLIDTISVLESTLVKREYCNRLLTCLATHVADDGSSGRNNKTVKLKIRVPLAYTDPILTQVNGISYPQDATVALIDGESVSFECSTGDVDPPPSFTWYMDNVKVYEDNSTASTDVDCNIDKAKSRMNLTPIHYSDHDEKVLTCVVTDVASIVIVRSKILLKVNVPVTYSHMELSVNTQSINDSVMWLEHGNQYIFQCVIRNAKPVPYITWNNIGMVSLPISIMNYSQLENGLWNAWSTIKVTADVNHHPYEELSCLGNNGVLHPASLSLTLKTFIFTEEALVVDDTRNGYQLHDGDVFVAMETVQIVITCKVRGWFPLPKITWSVDGNQTTDKHVSIRTDVLNNLTISYFTLEPVLSYHKRTVRCIASSILPHPKTVASMVALHVYSVPPSNTSLNIFNQGNLNHISSEEVVYVVKDVPQEFKCVVTGTKPEAIIQWTIGGDEQPLTDVDVRPSSSSEGLVDTTSVFRFVPTTKNHLQRLSCKTVLPLSGKPVFTDVIMFVSDASTTSRPNNTTENSSDDVLGTISPRDNMPPFDNPFYIAGLAGSGLVVACAVLFIIVIFKRKRGQNPAIKSISEIAQSIECQDYSSVKFGVSFDLPLEKLRFVKELSDGSFCTVFLAEAIGIQGHGIVTEVAVKKIKETTTESESYLFKHEINFLKNLKPHPNIMGLISFNINKAPLFMVMEYMVHGNLKDFLLTHSKRQDNAIEQLDSIPELILTTNQLVQFARDVASGMAFLVTQQVIHRDLAARNVLINAKLDCRVADFGLACHVTDLEIATRFHNQTPLPVRWMAPEALIKGTYSHLSDVWSFGIVLWEILSMGEKPYPGVATKDVVTFLQNGYKMPTPKMCDEKICNIITSCWDDKPEKRPPFASLVESFDNILDVDHDYLLLKFVK